MSNFSFCKVTSSIDLDNFEMFSVYWVDASQGNIEIETSTIIFDGYCYIFIRVDDSNNTVTIVTKPGQTINGGNSFSVLPNRHVEIYGTTSFGDGDNWVVNEFQRGGWTALTMNYQDG